jgi:hypothetical protein
VTPVGPPTQGHQVTGGSYGGAAGLPSADGPLYPLAVLRATLAACRAAYDRWAACADKDLTVYLDAALTALAVGFAPDALQLPAFAKGRWPGGIWPPGVRRGGWTRWAGPGRVPGGRRR